MIGEPLFGTPDRGEQRANLRRTLRAEFDLSPSKAETVTEDILDLEAPETGVFAINADLDVLALDHTRTAFRYSWTIGGYEEVGPFDPITPGEPVPRSVLREWETLNPRSRWYIENTDTEEPKP